MIYFGMRGGRSNGAINTFRVKSTVLNRSRTFCFPSSAVVALKPGDFKMRHQRLFLLIAFLSAGAQAQWLNFPTPGTPRTRDGKPNLAAPTPRAADGKPDLTG